MRTHNQGSPHVHTSPVLSNNKSACVLLHTGILYGVRSSSTRLHYRSLVTSRDSLLPTVGRVRICRVLGMYHQVPSYPRDSTGHSLPAFFITQKPRSTMIDDRIELCTEEKDVKTQRWRQTI